MRTHGPALGFTSRRRIEAFDAALSGNASASSRISSRELALAAALGAAGTQIAASMPRAAAGALRDNLMAAAAHQSANLAAQAATGAAQTAAHTATQTASHTVTQTTTHAVATKAVGTKAATGLAAKLGIGGGGGLLGSLGTGSLVVPAAIGAIAANLLVGTAFVTAHHAGLDQTKPLAAKPLASTAATAISPVAAQLQSQLDVLSSLEHVSLTAEQATQFLTEWSTRTQQLVSLSGVRAAVREFATKVQAELDHLSALLPTKAVSDVRRVVTNAVAALPLLGTIPVLPNPVTTPITAPTNGTSATPNATPTPTTSTGATPTTKPTPEPTVTLLPLPLPSATTLPITPDIDLPAIDVGPIHVPPIEIPGVHL